MRSRVRKAGLFLLLAVVSWTGCQQDPQLRRDRHFREGKKATEQEKYLEAEIQFRNAVKADPDFSEGYYHLGLTDRKLGRLPEAARAFQQTLDLEAEHTGAALELGEIYLLAKEPQRARELAEGILDREEGSFSARILLAKSYLGDKKFLQAKKEFERAKELEPDNPAVYLASGIAEIGAGNRAGAEANFKEAIALDKTRIESYQDLANLYLGWKRFAEAEEILLRGTHENPHNNRIHLALADFYYRTGRLPQVHSSLESLKEQATNQARLHSDLGDFWLAHHQVERAVREYLASDSIQPSEVLAKKIVSAYITLGEADNAAHWNNQILAKNPLDPEAKTFRGAIAYLHGDTGKAISDLEAIVGEAPSAIFAHYYLGSAYLAEGRLGQARAQFYDCIKYNEKFVHAYLRLAELSLRKNDAVVSAEYAKKVIAASPWLLDGYLLAADAALMERETVKAEQALKVAQRLSPENPLVHERWAVLYTLKKRYARAEREYQLALAFSPTPDKILARMTRHYINNGRIAEGLTEVQRYIDSQGPSPTLYELLAQLHLAQDASAEAAEAAAKALLLDPNRPVALLYQGRALAQQGRLEEAEQSYGRAIQLNPEHLAAHLLQGDFYWQQRKFSQAIGSYRRAIGISPNSPVAQTGLARALADAGQDLGWALSLAQLAKQQRPEEPVVSDALAWVYHKKGMNDLAIPVLQECVAQDAKNPVYQYHLGMAYQANGQGHEAKRMLQAALRNGLARPYAPGAHKALATLMRN